MTRWIVACDQPFDEIEKPEFIALMSYAQNHTPPPSYSMPGRFTIKRRAMEMGSDTESEIRGMFKVRIALKTHFLLLTQTVGVGEQDRYLPRCLDLK